MNGALVRAAPRPTIVHLKDDVAYKGETKMAVTVVEQTEAGYLVKTSDRMFVHLPSTSVKYVIYGEGVIVENDG